MSDNNNIPPSSDALERTLNEILAAEPVLEGRNGQQLQVTVEDLVKELLQDGQLKSKLLSETRMGLGMGLGKFLAWKVWTEIEKSDKRKAASRPRPNALSLKLPEQHLGAVKQQWAAVRAAFAERTGFALSEPTLGPGDEAWSLEIRGGLLGRRRLPEDWFQPLVNFFVEHACSLLSLTLVKQMVEEVRSESPVVGEELERLRVPLTTIYRVLEELLDEGVAIQEMETILTAIVLNWEHGPDRRSLLSSVRAALSPWICKSKQVRPGVLRALKMGRRMEEMIAESVRYVGSGSEQVLVLEPQQRGMVIVLVKQALTQLQKAGPLVILCNTRIRKDLHSILRADVPGVVVLSEAEINRAYKLEILAVVDFKQAPRSETVSAESEEGVKLL